jgi:hypothetical protein
MLRHVAYQFARPALGAQPYLMGVLALRARLLADAYRQSRSGWAVDKSLIPLEIPNNLTIQGPVDTAARATLTTCTQALRSPLGRRVTSFCGGRG